MDAEHNKPPTPSVAENDTRSKAEDGALTLVQRDGRHTTRVEEEDVSSGVFAPTGIRVETEGQPEVQQRLQLAGKH